MVYVLSDIHGNMESWKAILKQINLQDKDDLYILGDVIDRHPYGIQILQQIIDTPNMHMLLGNHEYMMMKALNFPYDGITGDNSSMRHWFSNGGKVTLEAWNQLSTLNKLKIKNYLESLPLNIDIKVKGQAFKLIHAAVTDVYHAVKDIMHYDSVAEFAVWDRETILYLNNVSDYTIIFGHTPTINLQEINPLELFRAGNVIGIDCGSGFPKPTYGFDLQGRLACLRLDDMKIFYSYY